MDKIPARDIKEKSDFLKWIDNFWYHNKITVIVSAFLVFIIVICTFQMCSKKDEDITVLYAGPYLMTSGEREGIRSVFNYVMPGDFDGDGNQYTELVTYHVCSNEQLDTLESEIHEDGDTVRVDRNYYANEYNNYSNMLLTGEYSLYFIDPWLYASLVENKRVQKLTDVLSSMPSSAVDEYGVRLGDTEIYKYYQVLQILPEDTIICLLHPYVFGQSSNEEYYKNTKDMFEAIVTFTAPN